MHKESSMQTSVLFFLQLLYTISLIGLAIYGFQALWLTGHFLAAKVSTRLHAHRQAGNLPQHSSPPLPNSGPNVPPSFSAWPSVTVQLPVYNERHVVERLLNACAMLDYPRTHLQIQLLDDSDDQTTAIAARVIESWQQRGVPIESVRRVDRGGFKAGALAHGFQSATGEFIAIFDADFVPPPDFLRRIMPLFFQSPPGSTGSTGGGRMDTARQDQASRIGFVQARWGHLNGDYSPLTRCQTLALDGHFVVEQGGRQVAGFAFGFNGSGGVWRRACIEAVEVGGWQADTLCEDLDLSYRAQLAGWLPSYDNDVEAPAEVPPQLVAFKRQQFRWAKGSIQTLRKLGGRVWQSEWPLRKRLAALIHLGSYLLHPLLLLLLLSSLPLLWMGANPGAHIAVLSVASLGPPLLYAVAQGELRGRRWWQRWLYLPVLTLLGTGICFSNTVAVLQGLTNRGGPFLRTPKFRLEDRHDGWQSSLYRLPLDLTFAGEFLLFCYALLTFVVAWRTGNWMFALYLLLYAGGFGLMIGVSLWQARPFRRNRRDNRQAGTSSGSVQRSAAS